MLCGGVTRAVGGVMAAPLAVSRSRAAPEGQLGAPSIGSPPAGVLAATSQSHLAPPRNVTPSKELLSYVHPLSSWLVLILLSWSVAQRRT